PIPTLFPYTTLFRSESIHAHFQPELHHVPHLFANLWIVIVQVRLVAEKPVPVVLLRNRVPRPVRKLRIDEDDPRAFVLGIGVAPDRKSTRLNSSHDQ